MAEEKTPTPASEAPTPAPAKGYGKRPVWQWVAIYAIVAAVVYGLIWWFFLQNTGTSPSSGGALY